MKYIILSLFTFITLLFPSCEGTISGSSKKTSSGSATFKLVISHIDSMGCSAWNKTVYLNIKDKQIPMLQMQTERTAALEDLTATYGKVLVRDANVLLNKGCIQPKSHEMLSLLFTELKDFPDAIGRADVVALKEVHDKAAAFVNSGVGIQRVYSYDDEYDTSYEREHIKQAESYLQNTDVKCTETRARLNKLTTPSGYVSRRKAFCKDIVSRYQDCTDSSLRAKNIAYGRLNICNGMVNKEVIADWKEQIDAHFKEIQPVNTNIK